MKSINSLLIFLNENWSSLIILIGAGIGLYRKIKNYMKLTKEQKVELAKDLVSKRIKSYLIEAEIDFASFKKSGEGKREEVLSKIYQDYPILGQMLTKEEVENFVDELIDDSLKEISGVINTISGKNE